MSKRKIIKAVFLSLILLTTSCTSTKNNNYITGASLLESSKNIDEQMPDIVKLTKKEKYIKHYQNGLYFEDFSKEKQELNQEYNKYLKKIINDNIKNQVLKDMKYILKSDVEIVNEYVKKYKEGKITAKEIFDIPEQSILSVKLKWYGFVDKKVLEEYENSGQAQADYDNKDTSTKFEGQPDTIYYSRDNMAFDKATREIDEMLTNYFNHKNVEYIEAFCTFYDDEILKDNPIEELEKKENIGLILKKWDYKISQGNICKMPYSLDYLEMPLLEYSKLTKKTTQEKFEEYKIKEKSLKDKYNIDFYQYSLDRWAAIKYPNVFFNGYSSEGRDYFLSTIYQYFLDDKIKNIIKEEGMEDRIVYLITVEENNGDHHKKMGTGYEKYDFGEGFNEYDFLKYGYTGNIYVTFIYLKGSEEEETNYKAIHKIHKKISDIIRKDKEAETLPNGDIQLELLYIYNYIIDDYGRRVVVDLFNKYPYQVKTAPPYLGLAGVFSLKYKTRAETPGFHYLDIFAKQKDECYKLGLDSKISENYEDYEKYLERLKVEIENLY